MEAKGHIGAMTGAFNMKAFLRDVIANMRESSGGPFPFTPIINSISYPIPSQETGKALVISLRLPESMGGGDHLCFDGSSVCLPFDYAIKK
ncbi:hypothetical protein EVAR_98094_1 [Eumeta japonica]|uniref:Uncharacterized protein n=1 Tax=Eumeta variegata TaxID=151549 RepID=A0A4C1XGT3_EUMVA|nr:hypothetical protein EVAR_98094_1 [Eumeta japonica]